LKNIIDGVYQGDLYVMNLKESEIQGIKSFESELQNLLEEHGIKYDKKYLL